MQSTAESPLLSLREAVSLAAESNRNAPWWEMRRLRELLGAASESATALGHDFGPDPHAPEYAFLASSLGFIRRSLVFLKTAGDRPAALVAFEMAPAPAAPCWLIGGGMEASIDADGVTWTARARAFTPRYGRVREPHIDPAGPDARVCGIEAAEEPRIVAAVQLTCPTPPAAVTVEPVAEIDLAGVRLGGSIVLFHTGMTTNRSSVFFSAKGEDPVRCLVTGLAPGTWEIWRNGWLMDAQASVRPRSSALYFTACAGNYFLRRLS